MKKNMMLFFYAIFFFIVFFSISKAEASMIADTLVIYQFINGYEASAGNDAVVLYNPTDKKIATSGYYIKHGNSATLYNLSGGAYIYPYSYYLIGQSADSTVEGIQADEFQGWSVLASSTSDKVWIGLFNASGDTVDLLGYGSNAANVTAEGTKLGVNLSTGNSIIRKPSDLFSYKSSGMIDSNNNSEDFEKIDSVPVPKNSISDSEKICFVIKNINPVQAGASFDISCSAVLSIQNTVYGDSVILDYTGQKAWANITVSAGNITPNTTGVFVNGVLSSSVKITGTTGNVTITIIDSYCTGSIIVNILQESDTTPPDDITGVRVETGNGTAVVKWTATTAADSAYYAIYYDTHNITNITASSVTRAGTVAAGLGDTFYLIINLTNDSRYYFAVAAFDTTGNYDSIPSSVASGTPAGPATATAPSITYPSAQDTNAVSIIVSGTGTPNDTIAIYVNTSLSGETIVYSDNSWRYALTTGNGLTANETNTIKARAYANGKLSSDTVNLIIFIDTAAPLITGQ